MHFFDEIKNYVGFTQEDVRRLKALYPAASPHFEAIVEKFYDALEGNRHTREIFEGPEQIERLRQSLYRWLEDVFSGPYDEDYFDQRRRIGRVHVKVGLKPQFMFGAMNIVRVELLDRLDDEPLEVPRADARRSVERILDLDLTIILHSYWDAMIDEKTETAAALASGLAHEIRNPLNAIGLNLTLLERRLGKVLDDEKFGPMLSAIRSEVRRIDGLTKDIKDFAKPMDVERNWHDASELLDEVATMHGPTLQASEIEFQVQVERPCPLYCDAERLKQALINLIKNAVEAMDGPGEIRLNARCVGPRSVLVLEDDGRGMQPTATDQAFDLFFTTKAAGTGIGLPIVKKIIDAHGGVIDMHSAPGSGTRFRITLPNPPQDDAGIGGDGQSADE